MTDVLLLIARIFPSSVERSILLTDGDLHGVGQVLEALVPVIARHRVPGIDLLSGLEQPMALTSRDGELTVPDIHERRCNDLGERIDSELRLLRSSDGVIVSHDLGEMGKRLALPVLVG